MSTQAKGFDVAAGINDVQDQESAGTWMDVQDVEGEQMWFDAVGGRRKVRILVAGTYSSQYKEIVAKQRTKIFKSRRIGNVNGEQVTENQREAAAHCALNWEGFVSGDTVFPCNVVNAELLFRRAPWIQEQVESQMQDHASFFKKPSNS